MLDGFRGIVVILVVLWYIIFFFGSNLFFFSYLVVDFFFLLSGVVLCCFYEFRFLNGMWFGVFLWICLLWLYLFYFFGICIGLIVVFDWVVLYKVFVFVIVICSFLFFFFLFNKVFFLFNELVWFFFVELIVNLFYVWKICCFSNCVLFFIMVVCMFCLVVFVVILFVYGFDVGFMRNIYYVSFLCVGFFFVVGVVLYCWYVIRVGGIMFSNCNVFLSFVGVVLLLCMMFFCGMLLVYDVLVVVIGFLVLVYVGMCF